jgi:4-carboxymuconolactone decarboxylase
MNETTLPSRILDIPADQMSEEQKVGIELLIAGRGRLLAPYRIWLHSPALLRAMEQLGTFLNKHCSLSEREIELGICLAAHHWSGEYVFRSHARRCLALGFPQDVLTAISEDRTPILPDARERAVYDVTRLAVQEGAGSDEAFDFVVTTLGRNGFAEVICLLGYYSAVAIGMKLHRVPPRVS